MRTDDEKLWTWMRRMEPRLDALAAQLARIIDDDDEPYFCARERWYQDGYYGSSIKSRLIRLAGWWAEAPELRNQRCYDVSHLALYRILPDCRNCACIERLGGPVARMAEQDRDVRHALNKREIRAVVWDKTDGHCVYCAKKLHPFRDFTIDHVLARANGGKDELDNLMPSCMKCNSRKGADDPPPVVIPPKNHPPVV